MKQMWFPIMSGEPAQVGNPWAIGDKCIVAAEQCNLPDVGTIVDLRRVPVCEMPEDKRPRQAWISHVWRALIEWPDGLQYWTDLVTLCTPKEGE